MITLSFFHYVLSTLYLSNFCSFFSYYIHCSSHQMPGRQRGGYNYRSGYNSGYNSRRTSIAEAPSELGDLLQEDYVPVKRTQFQQKPTTL